MKSIDPLVVFVREYKLDQESSPSRQLSTSSDNRDHDNTKNHTTEAHSVNSDPFVKTEDIVFDIRIKRIAEIKHHTSSSSHHVQFRDINKHEATLAHSTFRVDSKDYSSLSEINLIFKGNNCLV